VKSLSLFFILSSAISSQAAINISADINRSQVAMGDQLILSVTVSGDQSSLPSPRLPPVDSFSVYDSGRSQSLNFVNGQVSASAVYTYVLSPRSVGQYKIPPITADGAAVPTPPLDVEVVAPGHQPTPTSVPSPSGPSTAKNATRSPRNADVFMTAAVDKPKVLVNEQLTLTVRFYNAVQLVGDLRYNPPPITGFLTEELPPTRSGMTNIDGRPYQFQEVKMALFPIQQGKLTIGPANIQCQIARFGGPRVDDFFDRFFAMAAPQAVSVHSEPITVQVDPLPAGTPANFSGVIGRLSAKISADRTQVKVGDAVTLTITVTGLGNLKLVPDPKLSFDVPALRFFETESSVALDKANDRIGGSKTFKTVVVPRVSGEVTIPPFEFPYFDLERRAHARASTPAITLHVAPGAPGTTPNLPTNAAADATKLTAIADDIRYLKLISGDNLLSAMLAKIADSGPWHAIPFAIFVIASAVAWKRSLAEKNPQGRRSREALKNAHQRLLKAEKLSASDLVQATGLVDEALTSYIADKLGMTATGLTLKSAVTGLSSLPKSPSPESLKRLESIWEELHLRRFAPGASGHDLGAFISATSSLLTSLDQEISQ
jgi:hypothetical protein